MQSETAITIQRKMESLKQQEKFTNKKNNYEKSRFVIIECFMHLHEY